MKVRVRRGFLAVLGLLVGWGAGPGLLAQPAEPMNPSTPAIAMVAELQPAWSFQLPAPPRQIRSSPAVGLDGTVFVVAIDASQNLTLHVIAPPVGPNEPPQLIWERSLGPSDLYPPGNLDLQQALLPVIGKDGNVYIGSYAGLRMFDPATGEEIAPRFQQGTSRQAVCTSAIDPDTDSELFAGLCGQENDLMPRIYAAGKRPDGAGWRLQKDWSYPDEEDPPADPLGTSHRGSLALDAGEDLLFSAAVRYFYVDPDDKTKGFRRYPEFCALDPVSGSEIAGIEIAQDHLADDFPWPPAIGAAGELFVAGFSQPSGPVLFALQFSDGTDGPGLRANWQWAPRFGDSASCDRYNHTGPGSPVIGIQGEIYLAYACDDQRSTTKVVALDGADGEVLWSQYLATETLSPRNDSATTPAIDAAGTVYVASASGLWVLAPENGEPIALFDSGSPFNSSPSIDGNGTLYVGDDSGTLYAFQASTQGPVASPWPMLGHDARHTSATAWPSVKAPSGLDFGQVPTGLSSDETIEVVNTGNVGLRPIVGLEAEQQAFKITANTCTKGALSFGASCTITLSFTPQAENAYTSVLQIGFGGDQPHLVSVHGSGGPPVGSGVSIVPTGFDFGTIITGQQSGFKRFDVVNNGGSAVDVSGIGLAGAGAQHFALRNLPALQPPLQAGETRSVEVAFAPSAPGAKRADLVVVIAGAEEALRASVAGHGGAKAQSVLRGRVVDRYSQRPISDASVELDGIVVQTDVAGNYVIAGIDAGDYEVRVRRDGYVDWIQSVAVPAATVKLENFRLTQASQAGEIRVLGASSRYRGQVTYLEGVDHEVNYAVNVDWGGYAPGTLVFSTTKDVIVKEVPARTTRTSVKLNPGKQLSACDRLVVTAVGASGQSSAPFELPLQVGRTPEWVGKSLKLIDHGDGFSYQRQSLVRLLTDAVNVPHDIAVFGGAALSFGMDPDLSYGFTSDGHYEFEWKIVGFTDDAGKEPEVCHDENNPKCNEHRLKKWKSVLKKDQSKKIRAPAIGAAGKDFQLLPIFSMAGDWQQDSCSWDDAGYVGLLLDWNWSKTKYHLWVTPIAVVPGYTKLGIGLSLRAQGGITEVDPLTLALRMGPNLRAEGILGAGLSGRAALEGVISGDVGTNIQVPEKPTIYQAGVGLRAGLRLVVRFWRLKKSYELGGLSWYWDWTADGKAAVPQPRLASGNDGPGTVRTDTVPRDYLLRPDHALFRAGLPPLVRSAAAGPGAAAGPDIRPFQQNVFPYSDLHIASAGDGAGLVWLADQPHRGDFDRTAAVFSQWAGDRWTDPVVVADDGTADFAPTLLFDPTGAAIVAWENQNRVWGADEPQDLQDTLAASEITAATGVRDPQSGAWRWAPVTLTDNDYFDHGPVLAGRVDEDVMLVWASNEANELNGDAQSPNRLWFSRWSTQTGWTAPAVAAELPYPLFGYTLAYRSGEGHVVLSMDADGVGGLDANDQFHEDRELFLLSFADGAWSGLAQLSDDDLIDANPRLAIDRDGDYLLVWMQQNRLVSARNFALQALTVIWEDESFSSNLADFQLARTADGKLAIVWAQATENPSDVHATFYDPLFDAWGTPKAITDDALTEKYLTAGFLGDRELLVFYNQQAIDADAFIERLEDPANAPPEEPTDIVVLHHVVGGDLALMAETFSAEPGNPAPGYEAAFTVTVENLGEVASVNVPVALYDGDPASGGQEVARQVIEDVLAPGDFVEITQAWRLPADRVSPTTVHVVVDPDASIADRNRANNHDSLAFMLPDLAIDSVAWENPIKGRYEIAARIINQGALGAGAFDLELRKDSASGKLIASRAIAGLQRLEAVDFDASYTAGTNEASSTLYLLVDNGGDIAEFIESNNRRRLILADNHALNRAPGIAAIPAQQVEAGGELVFQVNAYDPDNHALTLSAEPIKTGMTFTDHGDGTAEFRWLTPRGKTQEMVLTVTVIDSGKPPQSTSEPVQLTVTAAPVEADLDGDGDVDTDDLAIMRARFNQPASGPDDPADLNGDGVINVLDFRMAVTKCSLPRCAIR